MRVAAADHDSSANEAEVHLNGDLLDTDYCDRLPAAVVAALGSIDFVINNAAVITRETIDHVPYADLNVVYINNMPDPDAFRQEIAKIHPIQRRTTLCRCGVNHISCIP